MQAKLTLGILTFYYNRFKKIEERRFFQQLTSIGKPMGIEIIVFTPEDVNHASRQVRAEYYDQQMRGWKKKLCALPAYILDRCRYQPGPKFKQLRRFRAAFPQLTYLNRPLANKWVIHQTLSKHSDVRRQLPAAELYKQPRDVLQMLEAHHSVYLKPINGTGGRGILHIQKHKDYFLVQGRNLSRHIIPGQRLPQSKLLLKVKQWTKSSTFMVQQGIDLQLPSGKVHDYRLLMQKNSKGEWEVTGCAGRIGARNSVTSNLHGGGQAMAMNKLLKYWFHEEATRQSITKNIYRLGFQVVTAVEKQYGRLCELALDIATDRKGHLWLLEINPKPSRKVFSRIGQPEVYHTAMKRPLEYALWLSQK